MAATLLPLYANFHLFPMIFMFIMILHVLTLRVPLNTREMDQQIEQRLNSIEDSVSFIKFSLDLLHPSKFVCFVCFLFV